MKPLSKAYENLLGKVGRNVIICVICEFALSGLRSMYMSYATPYMLAVGLTEMEIGTISSVNLGVQMVICLIGGFLSDKYGRLKTVTVLDYICWATPLFIWAVARNFYYFLVAAIFNSFFRASYTAFSCLFIEDVPREHRTLPYTLFQIVSIVAGFMAPLGVFLIEKIGLVPAMRLMYGFCGVACVITTYVRFRLCRETREGVKRMEEMKGVGLLDVLRGYLGMMKHFFTTPSLILIVLVQACTNICMTLRTTWLAPLITESLGLSEGWIGYAATVGSVCMLLTLLLVMPRITPHTAKTWPLAVGLGLEAAAAATYLSTPIQNIPILLLATLLFSVGNSIISPCVQAKMANEIPNSERANMNSFIFTLMLLIQTPTGILGGAAAAMGARIPFALILGFYVLGIVFLGGYGLVQKKASAKAGV